MVAILSPSSTIDGERSAGRHLPATPMLAPDQWPFATLNSSPESVGFFADPLSRSDIGGTHGRRKTVREYHCGGLSLQTIGREQRARNGDSLGVPFTLHRDRTVQDDTRLCTTGIFASDLLGKPPSIPRDAAGCRPDLGHYMGS
jgi:hypothetical protein